MHQILRFAARAFYAGVTPATHGGVSTSANLRIWPWPLRTDRVPPGSRTHWRSSALGICCLAMVRVSLVFGAEPADLVLKDAHIVTLEENLEMAKDIGIEASTELEGAFEAAMKRHGADAKVVVLPFARYQLPRDAIRMPGEEKPSAMSAA